MSDLKTLLQKVNDACNYHRNIQTLLIEIFKSKNDLAPLIMGSMLKRRNTTDNLKNFQEFETKRKKTVYFGLGTLSYRSLNLWSLQQEINSLGQFKRILKQCACNNLM